MNLYAVSEREFKGRKQQAGVVLIVCLVILLVVTLLGVSNMQSSSMQLKMAKNADDRQTAFQAAEVTLKYAENEVVSAGHSVPAFQACTGTGCYNSDCNGGYCFSGQFDSTDTEVTCEAQSTPPASEPVWLERDSSGNTVWNDSGRHVTYDVPGNLDIPEAKYIVEFMCYGDKSTTERCEAASEENCAALYRITSLATNEDDTARVMLQSMVKVVYQ